MTPITTLQRRRLPPSSSTKGRKSATAAMCLLLAHSKRGKASAFVPSSVRSPALLREGAVSWSASSSSSVSSLPPSSTMTSPPSSTTTSPPSSATALHLFGFSWDNDMEVENPKYLDDVVQRLQKQAVSDLMLLSSLFETATPDGTNDSSALRLALSPTTTRGSVLTEVTEDEEDEERREATAAAGKTTTPSNNKVVDMLTSTRAAAGAGAFSSPSRPLSVAVAETLMRAASAKVEDFLMEATSVLSPTMLEEVIFKAGSALTRLEEVLEQQADASGGLELLLQAALSQPSGANQETVDFVRMANGVLNRGYVDASKSTGDNTPSTAALMHKFPNVSLLPIRTRTSGNAGKQQDVCFTEECRRSILTAASMANLAGAIYENTEAKTSAGNHAFVARGMTQDVAWMVTDSIGYVDDFRAPPAQQHEDETDVAKEEPQQKGDAATKATTTSRSTASRRDPFNFSIGRITLNNNKKSDKRSRKSAQATAPTLVRTLTIRGFDASDETVDRERLLDRTCNACPEPILGMEGLAAPRGLLGVAQAIYDELRPQLVEHLAPTQKIVLNGHSIGGSLATLILLLMTRDLGVDWVKERVLKVFTFGAPPVVVTTDDEGNVTKPSNGATSSPPTKDEDYQCSILNTAGLPASMVYSYVQPWDPIPRLFSEIDPLYPLVGDLGEDGKTLYASGPSRTLRVVTRAITEVWEGWPRFRDNFRTCANQEYRNVGIVHVLMPDRLRYVTDRLVSVRVGVPLIDQVLRVPSDELYEVMLDAFPMDTFRLSNVIDAVRGFVHHFFPAYDPSMNEFAARLQQQQGGLGEEEEEETALSCSSSKDEPLAMPLVAEPAYHEEGAWM